MRSAPTRGSAVIGRGICRVCATSPRSRTLPHVAAPTAAFRLSALRRPWSGRSRHAECRRSFWISLPMFPRLARLRFLHRRPGVTEQPAWRVLPQSTMSPSTLSAARARFKLSLSRSSPAPQAGSPTCSRAPRANHSRPPQPPRGFFARAAARAGQAVAVVALGDSMHHHRRYPRAICTHMRSAGSVAHQHERKS